jgi:phosphoribosylformylglycinamidine synthase
MVLAIDPENKEAVEAILKKHHVEGTVLGEFTDDQRLFITYEGQTLCDLPMEFLHDGLDQLDLVGTTERFTFEEPSEELLTQTHYNEALQQVLAHPNVCSKEPIIRRYDHNIQGTAVQMPLAGKTHAGPNNASVLEPLPGMKSGVVIGHGLNPILNRIDPYRGSQWAIYEAVANVIAQGADPAAIALVDNFIWPKPDEKFIADLSHSVDACVDTANALKMPFISGKDSLSSTYRRGDTVVHIPPVLCVSAMGMIPDISKTVSSCFKKAGNKILLIGKTYPEMGGSIYYDTLGVVGNRLASLAPAVALKTFQCLHTGIQQGLIWACQDVSEGGMVAMVAEMAFGNKLGASLEKNNGELKPHEWLFSESPGRFVVEVAPENVEALTALWGEITWEVIGEVTSEEKLKVEEGTQSLVAIEMSELRSAWQAPMKKIFG